MNEIPHPGFDKPEQYETFTTTNGLEEAAQQYAEGPECTWVGTTALEYAFIAGAKWQKQHDAELIEIAYNDGITIGMTKQKEQMLKEAVEAKIYGYYDGSFELIASWLDMPNNSIYKNGDKVRIIICKKED